LRLAEIRPAIGDCRGGYPLWIEVRQQLQIHRWWSAGQRQRPTYNKVEPGFTDPTTASNYSVNGGIIQPEGIAGTSFAAPLVTGAAAVLVQYAKNGNLLTAGLDPFDHRVLKAILMNGAQKLNPDGTPLLNGVGGASGKRKLQSSARSARPRLLRRFNRRRTALPPARLSGSFPFKAGLIQNLGTGQLDMLQSLINYAAGEQGPGIVSPIGWDYHVVPNGASGTPNQTIYKYDFVIADAAGFQATLDWDSPVTLTGGASGNTLWAPNATLTRGSLQDLDLYLFQTNGIGGPLTQNLDFSTSLLDNDQHIYVPLLDAGAYELDVVVRARPRRTRPTALPGRPCLNHQRWC